VRVLRSSLLLPGVLLLSSLTATAQEPTGPPPAPGTREPGSGPGLELLPGIGRIGAQVGLLVGSAWNPYDAGDGLQGAGYIRLPLATGFGGRLSYEVRISLGRARASRSSSRTRWPWWPTSPRALPWPPRWRAARGAVSRAARGAHEAQGAAGLALRADSHLHGPRRARLRPYVTAGLDAVVVITTQDPLRDESQLFTGQAPFDAELIGGLIGQAPELTDQGLPTGQGNMEFGFHAGAGLELRVSRGISINADYRYSQWGESARQNAVAAGVGFHW